MSTATDIRDVGFCLRKAEEFRAKAKVTINCNLRFAFVAAAREYEFATQNAARASVPLTARGLRGHRGTSSTRLGFIEHAPTRYILWRDFLAFRVRHRRLVSLSILRSSLTQGRVVQNDPSRILAAWKTQLPLPQPRQPRSQPPARRQPNHRPPNMRVCRRRIVGSATRI
jgi:hypothetical protein